MMPAVAPELSVVLVSPGDYDVVRKTVVHLGRQTVCGQIELFLVGPSAESLRAHPHELEGFHSVHILEIDPRPSVTAARIAAFRHAAAPVVVIGEDHSYPEPEWAEALIQAHRGPWGAVGPIVLNANPKTVLSWAGYLPTFGHWGEGSPGEVDRQAPWHNTSYKKDLILAYGDQLLHLLEVEGFLQEALKRDGHQIWVERRARTHHVNFSLWRPLLVHAFNGGIFFGTTRAREERWSPFKRLLHIVGSPLVPFVRIGRILKDTGECLQPHPPMWKVIPVMLAGAVSHAAGEVWGYVLGPGDVAQRYSYLEMERLKQVNAEDGKMMMEVK